MVLKTIFIFTKWTKDRGVAWTDFRAGKMGGKKSGGKIQFFVKKFFFSFKKITFFGKICSVGEQLPPSAPWLRPW